MWFRKELVFEIEPYAGVGPIKLGASRQEVRHHLGGSFQVDPRCGADRPFYTPMDYFKNHSVFAYYDSRDNLDALEFHNNAKLWFHQKEMFSKSLEHLIVYFGQIDTELGITDDGFDSKKYGIGVWVSCVEDARGQTAETIIVYKRGYYDEASF